MGNTVTIDFKFESRGTPAATRIVGTQTSRDRAGLRGGGTVPVLVIADQSIAASSSLECTHAIMRAGRAVSVRHQIACDSKYRVLKTRGKREPLNVARGRKIGVHHLGSLPLGGNPADTRSAARM